MTILRLIGIFILNTIGVLVIGCTEQKDPNEPVTAYILAEISDKVFVTTFPRCNYEDAYDLDEFSTKSVVFNFQAKTFSGNLNNEFHCPSEDLGMVFRTTILPLYKLEGKVVKDKSYFYFPYSRNKVLEQIPHVEYLRIDSTQAMLIIEGMQNQTSPLKLVFTTYDEEGLSSFHNYYRLYTLLDNDFELQYQIRIMNDDYNQRFNISGYDTQFAQAFKDVIAADGRVLDHPEIIQGFVDNNERVIEFFKAHGQIITKIEFDKINDADHTVE
ncbi:hypothetical protein [Psychrobacter submarinus]|uniref:hypothetical protein n=1 Tax=Psychrobacter submarinus TaxID=154108 RepID=UPI001918A4E3|nr:hypothetical protein [Psychrobacter submarinus]